MGLLDFLIKTIGVDPGSQNLRLIHNNELVFNETTELSIHPGTSKVSGYGNESIHAEPNKVVKPVNTVIADFYGFEHLLRRSIRRSLYERTWLPSNCTMYFSVPMSATEVEKRAYRDSGEHAGAKEVFMIHAACSSAIGMGILFKMKDFILVDFSASKVEITIFANSLVISEGAIRIGTWQLQHALRNYIFRKHDLTLTDQQLESLLFDLPKLGDECQIQHKTIKTDELREVLNPYFIIIEDQILETLERAGNHKRIDQIISNGFRFTGGGAYVYWLTDKIALNGKMNTTVSSNPLLDNINGLKKVLQNPKQFHNYLMT
ncbi:MAG: rod shape-determining protein [Cyclobacteriaceae bacterium]